MVYTFKKYIEGYEIYNIIADTQEEAEAFVARGVLDMDDFECTHSEPMLLASVTEQQ